jgi:hypothetical protein
MDTAPEDGGAMDEVPVGTLCATSTETGTIDSRQKAEMIDVARHLERFLEVYYRYPEGSAEREIMSFATRAAIDSIYSRSEDIPPSVNRKMIGIESQIDGLYEKLGEVLDLPETYQFSTMK